MFTKEEIKSFIIKYGNKWFFPDFSNKITWYVITLGASFILVPAPVKLFLINWVIDIFNLNSGLELKLPELESSSDYTVGIILIIVALLHNLGYKYFSLEKSKFEYKISRELKQSDYKLLETFIVEFPSNSDSCLLLKEHDFGNIFNRDNIKIIEEFLNKWNSSEYKFMDNSVDSKRANLYKACQNFLSKIATYTGPIGTGTFSSAIPDNVKENWDKPEWVYKQIKELNDSATKAYELHQEFILFAKSKL